MKLLTRLDEKLDAIEEQPEAVDSMPTFRRIFKLAVGNSLANSPEEAVDLFQVGLKLKQTGDSINLEDAEFKLLKETISKNGPKFVAHILGQVLVQIKGDEDRKE